MSAKGFRKFKKNFGDHEDSEYGRNEYFKRKTPRHRPSKEDNAIYADPPKDKKDFHRKEYD